MVSIRSKCVDSVFLKVFGSSSLDDKELLVQSSKLDNVTALCHPNLTCYKHLHLCNIHDKIHFVEMGSYKGPPQKTADG